MESYQKFIHRKNLEFKKISRLKPFKDIARKGYHIFEREAWTFLVQHNQKKKVFIIERLKRVKIIGKTIHKDLKKGDIEYRICYYIVGQNGRTKNKWVWGQFCPLIPAGDLDKLIIKAKNEGTVLV